ncbi:MAG: mitofilin family membrane protein, partial [Pseudomonadota bacterium]
GDTPRTASTDNDEAVDAEIVEEAEAATFEGKEQPEERAEDEGMALSDETPEDTPIPEDMDPAANENDSTGGGLATPFTIILGALVVIGALVIFLNRNGDSDAVAQPREATPPVVATPITEDKNEDKGEDETTVAAADPTDNSDTEVNAEAEPESDLPSLDDINPDEIVEITGTPDTDETEQVAAEDSESSANETVAAMATAQDDNQATEDATSEEAAARRSALIARAAERNRARRAGLEQDDTTSEDTSSEHDETTVAAASDASEADEVPSEDKLPENADHSETSVTEDISTAAVQPNEIEDTAETASVDSQETSDNIQATEDLDSARVAELESTVAGLVADLEAVRDGEGSSETPPATPAPDLEELKSDVKADVLAETEQVIAEKLQETEREVQALRSELTEQQRLADERLTALTQKIDTLETSELTATKQSTLLLALSDLEDSIESGEPFLRELDNIERISPTSRSFGALRDHATTGLLTDKELTGSYALAARRALSSAKREDAEGPLSRLGANLSGLFSVRKVGDVEGDTPSAMIARAEARLESGDLQGAVDQLDGLTGPARDAFADWIEAAKAKAEVEREIEALERAVTARAG